MTRRIVSRVQPGDLRKQGQWYGLIRFGARVAVVLPHAAEVAQVGDIVKEGETILAVLKESQGV